MMTPGMIADAAQQPRMTAEEAEALARRVNGERHPIERVVDAFVEDGVVPAAPVPWGGVD